MPTWRYNVYHPGTCSVGNDGKRKCNCPAYTEGDYCEVLKCEKCPGDKCLDNSDCTTCFGEPNTHHAICTHFTCSLVNMCKNYGSNLTYLGYCKYVTNKWTCECKPGTSGKFCETFAGTRDIKTLEQFLILHGKFDQETKTKNAACIKKSLNILI